MRNRIAGAVLSGLLIVGYVGAGAVLMGSSGCALNKPPGGLSNAGQVSFYSNEVGKAILVAEDFTKGAHDQGLISGDDAAKIGAGLKIASQAGKDLNLALKAGADATDAKAKALAAIRSALESIPPQLSATAQHKIAPYLAVIRAAIDILGSQA